MRLVYSKAFFTGLNNETMAYLDGLLIFEEQITD